MNHIVMITGIHKPESFQVSFERLPVPEPLKKAPWTKLDHLVEALRNKLHGSDLTKITSPCVMEALKKLRGPKMCWVSSLEYCIEGENLPNNYGVSVLIPTEDAELLQDIFIFKGLIGMFDTAASR